MQYDPYLDEIFIQETKHADVISVCDLKKFVSGASGVYSRVVLLSVTVGTRLAEGCLGWHLSHVGYSSLVIYA